jgi:hypothetical protein
MLNMKRDLGEWNYREEQKKKGGGRDMGIENMSDWV